ncbi:hypothetical protein SAMN05216338_1006181 [Bradyrhizobium sp. Rc2d]|uniref:hypothetical protein n=1 Tax=Bradyrhizobium sp. Rc2d TaxID=1855321 RepID=UPI00088DCDE4|nr:hypothetical protein [Bradyrhizobium sp. Rc2d]SDH20944.1 hypothetical protein SAMN05216338_1006181 [Bradyrhizobium sp. Rc2d]
MNDPVNLTQPQSASILPAQFEALCPPPQLLPGENIDHYHAVQVAIFRDINPQSAIEWLLAIDIAELSWEMQRYRVLRHRLLSIYRQKAIEMTLRRIDLAGIAPDFQDVAEIYTINNALDWQLDASAARDIEARLRSYGLDQHAISMEVYVQAREILSLFESLLNGAQLRRLLLLKEINNLRRSNMVDLAHVASRKGQPSGAKFPRRVLADEALHGR